MESAVPPIESILAAAVEISSAEERRAFVEQACAGDAELKARVEQMIEDHFQAGSFLESPARAVAATIDEPRREEPGTVIGPYKLLEQIGEGGFGIVFMAEQTEPVRRKVALKVLKPGMDTRQVVARFEAERQALAIMDHPNIAKVFDGGMTGEPGCVSAGRPYFVMELVRGMPITEFCDQNHLTPRQRLELFIPVCQAVQHAHQKGIIHRDLKPSNVLVTEHDTAPVPKVIDFGVAKALGQELTDKTLFTGFAQMVGTPLYMSPEQAGQSGLDIDTRSDIYSLGVLLYELLTGTTPFDKERFKQAAYDDIRRIIREEDPPKPSTRLSDSKDSLPSISAHRHMEPTKLTKLVRGELDWIVMKALEKDRNRRYETANGFAMDVQRYLADEPVQACPPSAWYRLKKFARRHKTAAVVTAGFVIMLLVGAATSTYFALEEAARAKESAAHAEAANRSADLARKNFQKARAAVDRMLFRVAAEQLIDTPQTEILRKKLLEDALKFHKEFLAEAGDDPTVRRDAAFSEAQLAALQFFLGRGEAAEGNLRRAIGVLEAVVRDHPEYREAGWKLAWYRIHYYYPLRDREDRARAGEQIQAAVELAERLYREAPREADLTVLAAVYLHLSEWFERALRFDEAELWVRKSLVLAREHHLEAYEGWSLASLGSIFKAQKRIKEAREALEQGRQAFDRYAANPEHFPDWEGKAAVLSTLSELVREAGEADQADALLAEVAGLYERLADSFPRYQYYAATPIGAQQVLARHLSERGRLEAADVCFRKAADRAASLARAQPSEKQFLRTAFDVQAERVRMWRAAGRQHEAKVALDQISALVRDRAADPACMKALPDELAVLFLSLATLQTEAGDNDEAGQSLRRATAVSEKIGAAILTEPAYRDRLARAHYLLGGLQQRIGQAGEAEKNLRQAIAIWTKLADDVPSEQARRRDAAHGVIHYLTPLLQASGRAAEAEQTIRRALADWEKRVADKPGDPDDHRTLMEYYGVLSNLLVTAGRHKEAEQVCTKAIDKWSNAANLYMSRARVALAQQKPDKALPDFSKAIELGRDTGDVPWWYMERANAYAGLKQDDKALADLTKAIALRPTLWDVWVWRGGFYYGRQQWDQAIADYSKAIELKAPYWPAWHSRGVAHANLKEWEKTIPDYVKAVEMNPTDANLHNDLAWLLATCPDAKLRQPARAVEGARKAVELAPKEGRFWTTLGVVHYRTEDWKAAIEALTKATKLGSGGDSLFFLAMAHAKLDHQEEARQWYDRAVQWMEKNAPQNEELRRFRDEAANVLGIDKKHR